MNNHHGNSGNHCFRRFGIGDRISDLPIDLCRHHTVTVCGAAFGAMCTVNEPSNNVTVSDSNDKGTGHMLYLSYSPTVRRQLCYLAA